MTTTEVTERNPLGVPAHRHVNPDGSIGGWVAETARVSGNARVYGNAWVSGNARVYGNAWVSGNARVSGNAWVSGDRHVVTLGPVGSEDRYITCHRTVDGHLVVAGCWQGTLDELAERIAAPASAWGHGSDDDRARWAADYEQAIEFLRPRVAEWDQHKREEMKK